MKRRDCLFKVFVAPSKISGRGLFAGEHIPWGHKIIQYVGQKISSRECERRGRFHNSIGFHTLFELDKLHCIDGWVNGNEAVFANHSHKNPNAVVLRDGGEIWLCAGIEDIKKGDEITFNYGFEF